MKAIQKYSVVLLLLFIAVSIAGCGNQKEESSAYSIFYINKDITKIVKQPYEPVSDITDTNAMIDEFLGQLKTDPEDVEYKRVIPKDVTVLDYSVEGELLTLYFDKHYSSVEPVEEALVRAAIVRTMVQIDGVECLTFYVGDAPLSDQSGNPIGVMTNDSFIENPGEQINSIQTATLVLYFADEEGSGLIQETQEVHYSSNISMEKLVMEHLLEGPKSEHAKSAIPEGTKLMSVSVLEGVCYVSLDESFLNQDYNVEEPVVIYSIVNSLSEISTISKVQISVNGDTSGVYRDSFALDKIYERNLDYVDAEVQGNVIEEGATEELE